MNLAELLFGKPKMKGKISIEVDDEIEKAETKIEGNLATILTMVSLLCSNLHEHGIPKELVKGAIAIGFDEDKEKNKKEKVIEKTIVIDSEEKAREIKKFLKKLSEED